MSKLPYEDTSVSVTRSRSKTTELLDRFGVIGIQWTTIGHTSVLRFAFEHEGRTLAIRLVVNPEKMGREWKYDSRVTEERHLEKESKRLHQAMHWYIKAKLVAIESGLEGPVQAWLPSIEGDDGNTVIEAMRPHMDRFDSGTVRKVFALGAGQGVGR